MTLTLSCIANYILIGCSIISTGDWCQLFASTNQRLLISYSILLCRSVANLPLYRSLAKMLGSRCGVSSPVSTTLGFSGFSRYENHSSWFVIWFEDPELTYHTWFGFEVLAFIELALCFITKVGPDRFSAPPKPLAQCDRCQFQANQLLLS